MNTLLLCTLFSLLSFITGLSMSEAMERWPFCNFEESSGPGGLKEHVLSALGEELPSESVDCIIDCYEWFGSKRPNFDEMLKSEASFLIDLKKETAVSLSAMDAVFGQAYIFRDFYIASTQVDSKKYNFGLFINEGKAVEGVYMKAKDPKDTNMVFLVTFQGIQIPTQKLYTEEEFLNAYDEKVPLRSNDESCFSLEQNAEDSDEDSEEDLEQDL
jgi:hypothetical protein